ncbi:MAG: hypothetical protein LBR44_03285 [Clostridiales Family XIII bacterium]|jgi:hypothetical protein|nr:hypothetical protein [Clostridiales Family XIII bacterium]
MEFFVGTKTKAFSALKMGLDSGDLTAEECRGAIARITAEGYKPAGRGAPGAVTHIEEINAVDKYCTWGILTTDQRDALIRELQQLAGGLLKDAPPTPAAPYLAPQPKRRESNVAKVVPPLVVVIAIALVAKAFVLPNLDKLRPHPAEAASASAVASAAEQEEALGAAGGMVEDIKKMIPGFGADRSLGGETKGAAKEIAFQDLFDGRTSLKGLWFTFEGEVMTDEGGGVYRVNVTKDDSELMGEFMPYKDTVALYVSGAAAFQVGDIIRFTGQADGSVADASFGASVQMPKILAESTDIRVV